MEGQNLTEVYAGKFLGSEKIVSVEAQTPPGGRSGFDFKITLENGTEEVYPQKGFVAVVSDEPLDATSMRDRQVNLMVVEILDIVRSYNIPFSQFTYAMTRVANQFQNHFNRANAILWFGNASRYVPGADTMEMLSLNDADRINDQQPPN